MSLPGPGSKNTNLSYNEKRRIAAAKKAKKPAKVTYKGPTISTLGPKPKAKAPVKVVTSKPSANSTATTTRTQATYSGQTANTLGPKVPAKTKTPTVTYKGQTSKTLGPKVPAKPVAKKPTTPAKPKTVAAKSISAPKPPVVAGSSSAPRVNPNLAPGAPGGPKKSAAQLATEKKMRDQAATAASMKSAKAKLDAYTKDAESSVNAELLPAINDIKRQIAEIEARGNKGKAELDERGKRGSQNLEELYGRLNNFLGQTGDVYNEKAKGFRASTEDRYGKLQGEFDSINSKAIGNTNAELTRMGLGEVSPAATGDITRDGAFASKMAAVDREAALTTQDAMSSGFNQILGLQRNNAMTEGADEIGRFQRDNAQQIADLLFEMNMGMTNLSGKQGDIEATRGQKVQELIRGLMDRDYERSREEQQVSFNQNLATQQFGLEKAQAQAALQPQPASEMDILELLIKQQQLADMQYNSPSNPVGPNGTLNLPPAPIPNYVPSANPKGSVGLERRNPVTGEPIRKGGY